MGSIQGWDCPGGTVNKGETLEQALVREVHEETGIEAQKIVYLQPLVIPNSTTHYEIFWGDSETDQVVLSDEHVDFRWVDVQQLKKLTGFDLKPFLDKKVENCSKGPVVL